MNNSNKYNGFSSACVHGGQSADPNHAHLTPVYASSTYLFDTAEQGMKRFSGEEPGFIYSRWGNPTFVTAENKIAQLESFGLKNKAGDPLQLKAILHASGMAALNTLFFSALKKGDKVLSHFSLYGGTQELLEKIFPQYGVEVIIMDLHDLNKVEDTIKSNPDIRMLYMETPSNPTIQCVDLEALTALAKRYHLITAADNTFATPYLQQPFKYGIDFVMHSTTKFLNGHGTAIGGVLIGKNMDEMNNRIVKLQRLLGGNSNPFDAFLLTTGIKTLEVRMQRHCENAMQVAQFLQNHAAVQKVNYLGLATHPDFQLAKKQMKHPGAMLSFELKGGLEAGKKFINRLQMCVRAVSLGTCDTLISHPASMTHYGVPKQQREQYGITDGLIRMSVGIETVSDILNDLDQALQ